MNYPIELSFKFLAVRSQVYMRDAYGRLIGFAKEKSFKQDMEVFADENKTELRYEIKFDRDPDFSVNYQLTDHTGGLLGSVRRKANRVEWKAHYLILDASNQQVMEINAEKGWVKFIDAGIPFIGMIPGGLFNPAFIVSRNDGKPVLRIQKEPSLVDGKFTLTAEDKINESEEDLVLLSAVTMVMLEYPHNDSD